MLDFDELGGSMTGIVFHLLGRGPPHKICLVLIHKQCIFHVRKLHACFSRVGNLASRSKCIFRVTITTAFTHTHTPFFLFLSSFLSIKGPSSHLSEKKTDRSCLSFPLARSHGLWSTLSNIFLFQWPISPSTSSVQRLHFLAQATRRQEEVPGDASPRVSRCSAEGQWEVGVRGARAIQEVADMARHLRVPRDGGKGARRGRSCPEGESGRAQFPRIGVAPAAGRILLAQGHTKSSSKGGRGV